MIQVELITDVKHRESKNEFENHENNASFRRTSMQIYGSVKYNI